MEEMTSETFLPHVGSEFRVDGPAAATDAAALGVSLRLAAVRDLGRHPNAPRSEPFALEFEGPPQPMLEQRIYRLQHDKLGPLEIFLVPIGIDAAGGLQYEAVFN
jgi:hypothetical protein